jgi:hypothetical protein
MASRQASFLNVGQTMRLYNGCGAASAVALCWCNDGDTVFVLDPIGNIDIAAH